MIVGLFISLYDTASLACPITNMSIVVNAFVDDNAPTRRLQSKSFAAY